MNKDSEHEITKLSENVELHRFLNSAGVPYSAIYVNGFEAYSCVREDEDGMIKHFYEMTLGAE